ncbi:glutathione peroxidase [bacterium]|nr:glutathione peroxidase [bacterium]
MSVLQFNVKSIDGKDFPLKELKGDVLLIVNVASQCGFTPQYDGLEKLYEKYKGRGFKVLGFPCNQFGAQEPGSEKEIKQFCETSFGVTFPLFAKIDVNGKDAHPLYKYLTEQKPGVLGTEGIKWNFTKFLIDRSGEPIKRYAPQVKPEDITADLEKALG